MCFFLFGINANEKFSDIKLKGISCEGGRHLGADSDRGHWIITELNCYINCCFKIASILSHCF